MSSLTVELQAIYGSSFLCVCFLIQCSTPASPLRFSHWLNSYLLSSLRIHFSSSQVLQLILLLSFVPSHLFLNPITSSFSISLRVTERSVAGRENWERRNRVNILHTFFRFFPLGAATAHHLPVFCILLYIAHISRTSALRMHSSISSLVNIPRVHTT